MQLSPLDEDRDPCLRGPRVSTDVREPLLDDAIDGRFHRRWKPGLETVVQNDSQPLASPHSIDQESERGDQTRLVEHRGAKLVGEVPELILHLVEALRHLGQLPLNRGGSVARSLLQSQMNGYEERPRFI